MSQAFLGSFNGAVTPNKNMIDVFKENEIKANPNSILNFDRLVLKKFAISAPTGTILKINGKDIPMYTDFFELGLDQVDIYTLEFSDAVDVNIYYMY